MSFPSFHAKKSNLSFCDGSKPIIFQQIQKKEYEEQDKIKVADTPAYAYPSISGLAINHCSGQVLILPEHNY
jgi:prepilin-type processing-associated H-X9-DG protein